MSNRKSDNHFTVDFVNKQIVGTEASLNRAKHHGSDEYNELCELLEAHPRFKVIAKKIKKRSNKQTYKKLNFDFIEKYISIQPNADEIKSEYERVKEFAASMGLGVYPYTKSWFLKKFGAGDKPLDMKEAKEELIRAGLAVVQSEAVA